MIRWKDRRRGVWYPEDRLRVTLFGALFLVPLSAIFAFLVLEYVPGRTGLALSLGCLFMEGLGVCITSRRASRLTFNLIFVG